MFQRSTHSPTTPHAAATGAQINSIVSPGSIISFLGGETCFSRIENYKIPEEFTPGESNKDNPEFQTTSSRLHEWKEEPHVFIWASVCVVNKFEKGH